MKPTDRSIANAQFVGLQRPAVAGPSASERRRAYLAAQSAELAAAKANRERTAAPKSGGGDKKTTMLGLGKPSR